MLPTLATHSRQVGKLNRGVIIEELVLPLIKCNNPESGSCYSLGKAVELVLLVSVPVNQTLGCESKNTGPIL